MLLQVKQKNTNSSMGSQLEDFQLFYVSYFL